MHPRCSARSARARPCALAVRGRRDRRHHRGVPDRLTRSSPKRSGHSARSCSPTSWAPPSVRRRWATSAGTHCSIATTRSPAARSSCTPAWSSRAPVTATWPPGRPGSGDSMRRGAAVGRRAAGHRASARRPHRRVRADGRRHRRHRRAHRRPRHGEAARARSWSRAPCGTLSPAAASASTTAVHALKGVPVSGGCSPSTRRSEPDVPRRPPGCATDAADEREACDAPTARWRSSPVGRRPSAGLLQAVQPP